MTQQEWYALSPEQRVLHYNRNCHCEHKASMLAWHPVLIEEMSYDPYFSTAHMLPCLRPAFCECQTCLLKFGIMVER